MFSLILFRVHPGKGHVAIHTEVQTTPVGLVCEVTKDHLEARPHGTRDYTLSKDSVS